MPTKPRILTDEKFAAIPGLIADGKNRIEIAALFGCTTSTLQVRCSQRGISLRTGQMRVREAPVACKEPAIPEAVQLVSLRLAAKARGKTDLDLVNELIEIIVKDNLYDAILGKVGEMEAA